MQFSAVLNIFIMKTELNSIFKNDLKRKEMFSKNVQSYRLCSLNSIELLHVGLINVVYLTTCALSGLHDIALFNDVVNDVESTRK